MGFAKKRRNEAMIGKVKGKADKLRSLWEVLTDAMAQRLSAEDIEHNPHNARMVTSVLLLMAARSASRIGIDGENFAQIARMAHEVSCDTCGARRAARMWVARGGLGVA
jgi:hypothetical protein